MKITDEMVDAFVSRSSVAPGGMRECVKAGLEAALSASTAGPVEMRHDEGGYVEFLNEDVPTVVREIDGRVAILTTLEQPRKVVGYRVYDPGSSPSEVFGSASPAGPQCCMCGKKGLSTVEGDGGTECELTDGRWVCSAECWERVVQPDGVGVETFTDLERKYIPLAKKIVNGRSLNHPYPGDDTTRIVGFRVPADVAGLSEALFALDTIRAVIAALKGDEQ